MQDRQPASRPSIYYVQPALVGPVAEWEPHLDRCRAMGFSHVLIAPPRGDEGDLVSALAKACDRHGLSLWLDLILDRVAADAALAREQPTWFRRSGLDHDRLPDPRRTEVIDHSLPFEIDEANEADILAWWQPRLKTWCEAGAKGFRIERPTAVPPTFLRRLIAGVRSQQPDCRFMAWTPGVASTELPSLRDCDLDFTVASTAWWDFRAEWYFDERDRLNTVAPDLALAEPPFGPRLASRFSSSDELQNGYRRLIDFAATSENGWLMPMGFEFASATPLDSRHADPAAFKRLAAATNAALIPRIAEANALGAAFSKIAGFHWSPVSAPGAPVFAELSEASGHLRLTNADTARPQAVHIASLLARSGKALTLKGGPAATDDIATQLQPGEVRLLEVQPSAPVLLPTPQSRRQASTAAKLPRVAITRIEPAVEGGRYPVKRVVGQPIAVTADIFSDGHGALAADLLWRPADEPEWRRRSMRFEGNDRWSAEFRAERIGDHVFTIEAWRDDFASLQLGTIKKRDVGLDISLEITELNQFLENDLPPAEQRGAVLTGFLARLRRLKAAEKTELLLSAEARTALRDVAPMPRVRHEPPLPVTVDRTAAGFASWYELFPRSQSGSATRHGTFADVIQRLPAIRAMGFDTLYFPPIHPIGRINRKGRNNSNRAEPGDPGSPYAIGSAEGGHEAIHPELGTIEDFRRLRDAAAAHGLELALDFAIQCAPDHPWLKQHPEWFAWRPDGSVAYAENPPKKYEDIVNVDFYAKGAVPGLWLALRDIILYWCVEGVRTFRVDNPHTKPLPFWRWLIADVRARHPDTIFLAEAFTRPQVMYALAKLGFTQSYTYFTWRNAKAELESYLTELTDGLPKDFFRPHFFVNTPDINPYFLQRSGRAGFLIRAALAATLSGLWGVYSGFELCEGAPLPGREEYLDSEKYEIRAWDWNRPGNIVAEVTMLNRVRRRNPALQTHLGLRFQVARNDNIIFFSKMTPSRDNVILVAINLDPFHIQEASVEIPLWQWDLPDQAAIEVEDLSGGGGRFHWHGKYQSIRLDPYELPFAIWRVNVPAVAA